MLFYKHILVYILNDVIKSYKHMWLEMPMQTA